MADNNQKSTPRSTESSSVDLELFFHRFREKIWPQHGTKIITLIVLCIVAFFLWTQSRQSSRQKETELAEFLGIGFDHLYNNRQDSAQATLEAFLKEKQPRGLQLAKASLLLGNIYLQAGRHEDAYRQFQDAEKSAGSSIILLSGAQHGLATIAMEKGQWAEASTLLNKFVGEYGLRTGNLADRHTGKEPVDKIALVPDALWKLTLVQLELKQVEQAKVSAERLVRVYGESRQATHANKLLTSL